ncbi:Antagonist of mitotic exit network protein 1 [Nakaseomyces bracarensis]|uniref:Antagonist of mitotic exit network protein 1 n=1 Tax=Nakaseomyces bracarensis TaxID=273131 RepID=A0ABR4NYD7_9SACH
MIFPTTQNMENGSVKRVRDVQLENSPYGRPTKKITPNSSQEDLSLAYNDITPEPTTPQKKFSSNSKLNFKKIFQRKFSSPKLNLYLYSPKVSDENLIQNCLPTPTGTPIKQDRIWSSPSSLSSLTSIPNFEECKNERLINDFSELSIINSCDSSIFSVERPHKIFEIPEIVENIFKQLSTIEQETIVSGKSKKKHKDSEKINVTPSLSNCIAVNKLWYQVGKQILMENLCFSSTSKFKHFLSHTKNFVAKPNILILHKLNSLVEADILGLEDFVDPTELKILEFYVCPNILPPISWFKKTSKLETLVLPGNKLIDDNYLIQISRHMPNLKTIDLRACDNISDAGIVAISTHCKNLVNCNIGRHRNSNKITGLSVIALAKHTKIETLGVAGCSINDASLWELAQICGKNIKRLSLNNCSQLTNFSIPMLFAFNYFPNLSVLEIRNLNQITDVRHLVRFKLWKRSMKIPVLIEGCNRISKLITIEEDKLKNQSFKNARKDMTTWVNQPDNLATLS